MGGGWVRKWLRYAALMLGAAATAASAQPFPGEARAYFRAHPAGAARRRDVLGTAGTLGESFANNGGNRSWSKEPPGVCWRRHRLSHGRFVTRRRWLHPDHGGERPRHQSVAIPSEKFHGQTFTRIFTAISWLASSPNILLVRGADSPFKTHGRFDAAAKPKPRAVFSFAPFAGTGNLTHLGEGELIRGLAKSRFQRPSPTGRAAPFDQNDLLGGARFRCRSNNGPESVGQLQAGAHEGGFGAVHPREAPGPVHGPM